LLSRSKQPGPYVLVAHSFGGHIARVYAGRFADSVGGIVLVDPSEARQSDAPAAAAPDPPPNRPWSVSGLIDLLPPLGWERVKRLYQGDSAFPADLQKLPAGFRHRIVIASSLDQLVAEQSELDSMRASQEQAWAAAAPPSLPVVVITPVHPADSAEAAAAAERRELHRQLAATFASGTQVFAERSGHMVHEDQPALVTAVIRDVLAKVPGAVK
jgi:pimeloyl-ACP methyl ester carboxylesterase